MKKLLLFVFMFLVLVPVHGLENNSNVVRKYKYYRLNKVLGPMVLKNEVNDEFPFIDEDVYTNGELSKLSTDRPLKQDGREIYEYDGFRYSKLLDVNTVEIEVNKGYMLSDVSIESINGKIDYESNADSDILSGDKIVIYNLKESINMRNLIVKANGIGNTDKYMFTLTFKHNDKIVGQITGISYLNDIVMYGTDVPIKKDAYEDIYTLDKLDSNSNLIYKGTVKLYQYMDYRYQSYKLEREYYGEYLTEPFEDYIYRDEDDYIEVFEPVINVNATDNEVVRVNTPASQKAKLKQVNNKTQDNAKNTVSKNNNIKEESNKQKDIQLPAQYEHVLKISDKKTSPNKTSNNDIYYYFILVILIILLLLALKLKNKLKESYRW